MKQAVRLLRLFAALVCLSFASVAAAQGNGIDSDAQRQWLALAERAETLIDDVDASDATLEAMRSDLTEYRETFVSTRDQNSSRIDTLQSQLEALGPKPEDREEARDIAELRQRLTTQLDQLRVPRIVAEESYNRADGLIAEIDRTLRERQTAQMVARGPIPLNPTYWPVALNDVRQFAGAIATEVRSAWNARPVRQNLSNRLPLIGLLGVVGLILLARGRAWSKRFGNYMRQFGGKGTGVWRFVVSLARVLLPLLGIVALTQAALLSGLFGFRGTLLLERIPAWGAVLLVFRWLSDQIYIGNDDDQLLPVDPENRSQTRLLIDLLALMLVLAGMIQLLNEVENITAASLAVLNFPVIVITALIMLRFQMVAFFSTAATDDDIDAAVPELGKVVRFARRMVFLLAVIAPVLAALGYIKAASALVFPVVLTFALITSALVVHRFLVDVYAWLSRRGEGARDSLAAVLIGFLLTLAAVPILALIWGARISDLTEIWTKFITGFQIGEAYISPTNFLIFVVVFIIGYVLTQLIKGGLRGNILPKTALDPGAQNAIVAGTGYIGVFLAALVAITLAGFDLSSLAIVAGALSVGIGFGLQTIVSNFVSGIILLIERPISKGDWIEVGGLMGYVRDISVRSTTIETFDRSDVIVPNSDLISGTVTNYTRGNTVGRVIIPVNVVFGSDTRQVEKILLEIANTHPMVLANPGPTVLLVSFENGALHFEIRAILRDVNWIMSAKSDMNHEIAERFAQAGIETARPQRDLWMRDPGPLPAPESQSGS
ncbi:DUF3772 domain-containing protein [Pontibaca salina]|uniref:Mechanosensitive ion channel family protein n=1 Tax=Pontibaca salina TaxID=2795731 RepID=A0A934HR90_9RHOB|nr:DUF3772 domain-containing protein [Pontibaca salina]MBI6629180.1 mechanosensitive ion channel family protein [Pontibaca salina]